MACGLLAYTLASYRGVRSADGDGAVLRRFTGLLWVFIGAVNSCAKLYDDEVQAIKKACPDQFCADYRAVARAEEQERRVRVLDMRVAGSSCSPPCCRS